MTAPAEVILTDDRGRGPLGHPRTPYMRFEDEDGVITLHPIPTDVTRAEALMWKRNPREAARIASSLNAAREAIRRLIAAAPYRDDSDDPDLAGGSGSRWARRHLYRIGDDSTVPPEVAAFTIWIDTSRSRWWLTWSRDPHRAGRLLIHSLVPEPAN